MGAAGKDKRAKTLPETKKRGGARPGAGRKKQVKSYSDTLKEQVFKALDVKSQETGKNFGELLVDGAYNMEDKGNMRYVCIKTIADMMTVKEAVNKNINEEVAKPKIYLPEYKPIVQTQPVTTTQDESVPMQTH